MPRHSRETLGTLVRWYAGSAFAGMVVLLAVALGFRLLGIQLNSVTVDAVAIVVVALFVVGIVIAWRRIEPVLRAQQVRAMMTGRRSGLEILAEKIEERRRRWKP